MAVVWSLISTFTSLGWGADALSPLVDWSPMQGIDLGWVLPTAVAFVIGNSVRLSPSLLEPGTTIAALIANDFGEATETYRSALLLRKAGLPD